MQRTVFRAAHDDHCLGALDVMPKGLNHHQFISCKFLRSLTRFWNQGAKEILHSRASDSWLASGTLCFCLLQGAVTDSVLNIERMCILSTPRSGCVVGWRSSSVSSSACISSASKLSSRPNTDTGPVNTKIQTATHTKLD